MTAIVGPTHTIQTPLTLRLQVSTEPEVGLGAWVPGGSSHTEPEVRLEV